MKNIYSFMLMSCALFFVLIANNSFSQKTPALSVLKNYVAQNKEKLKLSDKDIESLAVTYDYKDANTGIQHIYATQKLNGLTVTGSNFSLHLQDAKQIEANHLVSFAKYKVVPVNVAKSSQEAVNALMDAITYKESRNIQLKQAATGDDRYTIFKRTNSSIWDIPVRLVYYNNERLKTLTPAWEVQMMDVYKQHYWLAYVDAATGIILEKKDLIIHCTFDGLPTDATNSKRVITIEENKANNFLSTPFNQQSVSSLPANQYRVYNIPFESPIDPGATHSLVTKGGDVLSSPDGWHKVSNLITYNYSRGNNVWAFQDPSPGPLGGVPSADPTRTAYPTNTTAGVYPVVEPFVFDYPINLNNEPETYMYAAIVNLFFWNNLMHDVFYYMGFDEASGNFQESNTFSTGTRGGSGALANDAVLAQAQDGGGTNNANFLTLPDGTNGQMQMYLWTASFPDSLVQITSSTSGTPAAGTKFIAIQGSLSTAPTSNVNLYTNPVLNAPLAIVQKNDLSTVGTSSEGCSTGQQSIALPANNVNGKIAVIDRGDCSFVEKVLGAQMGGAVGAIVVNNVDGPPIAMGGSDATGNAITIPAVMISKADGAILKSQLSSGATIIGSLKRDHPPAPKRDGDIDNGVISHEYGHGISNRLTGGGALLPLGGDEQGGEGWSDYVALYMTLRSNDLLPATSQHPFGVLPSRGIGNYVTYQNYDARGIREFPYSIDMNVNPATFGYVKRPDYAEAHSVGFVWCSMLYEMLQTFIDEYGMNDNVYEGANPTASHNPPASAKGNNIATRLVIEAMKLQPVNPTFVEERDAILKADTLLYNGQHSCAIWKAFAKRGLGYSAYSGTNGLGDERESFDVPLSCDPTQKRIRIVKSGPVTIPNNSLVTYTITVTNVYPKALKTLTVTDTLASSLTFKSATNKPTVKGKIIKWSLSLSANATKVITVKAQLKSATTSNAIFSDDQESGSSNWTADATATANWTYTTDSSQAFSGSHFWFVPDYDLGGSNTSLRTTNAINIPSGAELVFIHKFAAEKSYDGGVVEVSQDGTNWSYIPPTKFVQGGYTGIIPTANNALIGTSDKAAFTGASDGYIVSIAKLEDYVGKNIYIRFRMTSDATGGSIDGGGWWLDNVYVLTNRTTLTNKAYGVTTSGARLEPDEGANAYSTTSGFILAPSTPGATLYATATNQNVDLKWQTTSVANTSIFEIERKAPGDADFKKIGTLLPASNTSNFVYADKNAPTGMLQYRVKQVGKIIAASSYTNIAAVQLGTQFKVHLYPNPATDATNVSIINPSGKTVSINIFGVNGKKLATFNAGISKTQTINLPLQQLTPGTYWIEVRTDDASQTIQLIKQK